MKLHDQVAEHVLSFDFPHYNRNTLYLYSSNAAGSVPGGVLDHKAVENLGHSEMSPG